MEQIVHDMIRYAESNQNYEAAEFVYRLLERFAVTVNCPSNWRSLGEDLTEKYKDGWVNENCKLYDFNGE